MNADAPRPARFVTTRWSLVAAAAQAASPDGRAALETLCRDAWFPLYAFARRGGASPEDAQDLVQSFFAALLEKGYVGQADRERGRFRTFLLAAFRHHASHERAAARAEKRGGGVPVLSFDREEGERRYAAEPVDERSPERIYERGWALALLERVLADLEASYEGGERATAFQVLRPLLLGTPAEGAVEAAAATLSMTDGAVRVALHRMRARYREALRSRIADTVADPSEVDDEIRHLLAALAA